MLAQLLFVLLGHLFALFLLLLESPLKIVHGHLHFGQFAFFAFKLHHLKLLRFLQCIYSPSRLLKLRFLSLQVLQQLVGFLHLLVLLGYALSIGFVLGDQVLEFAFLVTELKVGIHPLFQCLLDLLLHLYFFHLQRLDCVLVLLCLGGQHGDRLVVFLQLRQLQLERLFALTAASLLLGNVGHMSMDLEEEADLRIEEAQQFGVFIPLCLRQFQALLHPGVGVLTRLFVVRE